MGWRLLGLKSWAACSGSTCLESEYRVSLEEVQGKVVLVKGRGFYWPVDVRMTRHGFVIRARERVSESEGREGDVTYAGRASGLYPPRL